MFLDILYNAQGLRHLCIAIVGWFGLDGVLSMRWLEGRAKSATS